MESPECAGIDGAQSITPACAGVMLVDGAKQPGCHIVRRKPVNSLAMRLNESRSSVALRALKK
jgi:hypothetical protein